MSLDLNDQIVENEINLENAKLRSEMVLGLIDNNSDIIFDIDSSKGYALYSTIIDISCEAIEHYLKYILRNYGYTWKDLMKVSHNLNGLYELLPDDIKEMIALRYLYPQMDKYLNVLENKELEEKFYALKEIIENGTCTREDKLFYSKIRNEIVKMFYNKMDNTLSDKDVNNIFTELLKNGIYLYSFNEENKNFDFSPLNYYYENSDDPLYRHRILSKSDEYYNFISNNLNKLNNTGKQVVNIRSRYPGQSEIRADISFLTSFSFCLNDIIENKIKNKDTSKTASK